MASSKALNRAEGTQKLEGPVRRRRGPRKNRCEVTLRHKRPPRPASAGRRGSDCAQNFLHLQKLPENSISRQITGRNPAGKSSCRRSDEQSAPAFHENKIWCGLNMRDWPHEIVTKSIWCALNGVDYAAPNRI